jgi:hypothetical protein
MCTLHDVIRTVLEVLTTAIVPSHDGNSGLPASLDIVRRIFPFRDTKAMSSAGR